MAGYVHVARPVFAVCRWLHMLTCVAWFVLVHWQTVYAVVALNVAVFALWKVPNHRVFSFMSLNFMSNAALVRSGRVWTLLTSKYVVCGERALWVLPMMINWFCCHSFSHRGLLHLGLNMFAVAHFSPEIIHHGYSRHQLVRRQATGGVG